MTDLKKVIKGLECLAQKQEPMANPCKGCGYIDKPNFAICVKDVASDALELLKEQEHGETFTVIDTKTGKEADEYEIALHEDWAKHLCYCDMEGWAIENDGTLLLVDECGRFAYADRERFKVVWDA